MDFGVVLGDRLVENWEVGLIDEVLIGLWLDDF